MSGVIAVQRADSQLNYLKQIVERFETFHAANFKKEIREFMDFFAQDDVIGHLSRGLFKHMTVSASAWHAEVQANGEVLPLPDDPVEVFAFRLGTLRLIRRNKLDLRFFVANHFKGAHLNEMLMNWKRLIVHPFAADCRAFADVTRAALPDSDWVEIDTLIETVFAGAFRPVAFGPRAWTDADDDAVDAAEVAAKRAPAPAKSPTPSPARISTADALDGLERAVSASRLADAEDLLRDVQALRLEVTRPSPQPERARARLAALAARGPLATACAKLKPLL